ncbi:MAG: hypothetical protein ACI87N_001425 [Flavobacteriales bacterium]|jgi:hypothetical protein
MTIISIKTDSTLQTKLYLTRNKPKNKNRLCFQCRFFRVLINYCRISLFSLEVSQKLTPHAQTYFGVSHHKKAW